MAKKKAKTKAKLPTANRDPLTMRETEVCSLIAQDMDNIAIGKELGISVETVKEHVQNSLRKTKFRSRVGLAVWFIQPSA
jgi:DNA-binding NarL/FixJ family response regulator